MKKNEDKYEIRLQEDGTVFLSYESVTDAFDTPPSTADEIADHIHKLLIENLKLKKDNAKLRTKVEANIDVNRIDGLKMVFKKWGKLVNKDATGTFRASIDEACELSSLEKDLAMVPKWDIETQQLVRALHSESGIKNFGVSKEDHEKVVKQLEALEVKVIVNQSELERYQSKISKLEDEVAELKKSKLVAYNGPIPLDEPAWCIKKGLFIGKDTGTFYYQK